MKTIRIGKKEFVVMNKEDLKAELYGITSPIDRAMTNLESALDDMKDEPELNRVRLRVSCALGSLAVTKWCVNDLRKEL